jgi:outer membrane murein-binding lipoprotein Lpp
MPTDAAALRSPRRAATRRLSLGFLIGAVVVLWVVLAFGRALVSLNEANDRAAALRAENAALQMRLEQGQAEMELAQTEAFQRMLARSMGMAPAGEHAFALEDGAPPPSPVAPLGGHAAEDRAPLDAWLRLLFGD